MEKRFGNKLNALVVAGSSIIFVNMVLPLLDSFTNMTISAINKVVNKWQLDMKLDRREAEAAAEIISPSPSVTHAVGFQISSESEEDDDYDE